MLQNQRLNQINYVIENAKYVKLNKEKLDKWSSSLKNKINYEHSWKKYKKDFTEKEIILLSFIIESMNFCFWKEPIFIYKDQKRSTAMMSLYIDKALKNKKLVNIDVYYLSL